MSHVRRYIKSNCVYELSFRARESLPFNCTEYMSVLIYGILSRIQRDNKVIIHHFIFEGSHPHIILTAKDADQCRKFYGQLKKQITDSCKYLLGLEHLTLWEENASVIQIATLEDAISKIGYVYANPSNDDLASSIERYPGVSSWQVFKTAERLEDCSSSVHPWIQLPMIPRLPSASVSKSQDRFICKKMTAQAKFYHTLEVYPLKWIESFIPNPSAEVVERVRREILENLAARELENSKRRAKENKPVMGANKLRAQALLKPHRPKKRGRRISVQSQVKEIRIALINELKAVSELCRQVYQRWKQGDFSVPWPPGTFPPPLPAMANCISYD